MADENASTQDPIVATLEERIARAAKGFDALNSVKSPGEEDVFISPFAGVAASMEALLELLDAAGIVPRLRHQQLALRKYAEALEAALGEAVVAKQQQTGVFVPISVLIDRPQG